MRQAIRITPEATFGVFNSGATSGQQAVVPLNVDNAFSLRPKPNMAPLRSQGTSNRVATMYGFTADATGALQCYVRPSQAAIILPLLGTLAGTTCLELGSFTIDEIVIPETACAFVYRRYTGCKATGSFRMDNTPTGCLMALQMQVTACGVTPFTGTGSITSSDFPTPTLSAAELETPYAFEQAAGNVTVGGARTDFTSLGFDFGNVLLPFRGETMYPSRIFWRGRNPVFTMANLYKSQADRVAYEAITPQTVSFSFVSGSHSVAFNLFSGNYYTEIAEDIPVGGILMQTLTLANCIDPTALNDFSMTIA
jgi:hypothetical protein